MTHRRIHVAILVLALAAGSAGLGQAQTPAAAPAPPTKAPAAAPPVDLKQVPNLGDYRIGPEDVLAISVWKNDAMSRSVIVRPDGKISLPLLNDVQASGLTPMELRDFLAKQLVEYMPSPEVSVIVVDPKSFKVAVIGEVPKPGRYELRSWTTVLDMLALVGGFTQFSARSKIFILRPEGDKMKRLSFNYNKAVTEGGEQENFYLRSGDIIVVP